MKRPPLITVANVLQSCLALVLAGLTTYLISLTRSQETLADPDSAETIHRLLVGAAVLGIPALITMIAAWFMVIEQRLHICPNLWVSGRSRASNPSGTACARKGRCNACHEHQIARGYFR